MVRLTRLLSLVFAVVTLTVLATGCPVPSGVPASQLEGASSDSPGATIDPATNPSATGSNQSRPTQGQYVVLAYNDLGMHCMNEDFSEMMILPPYNNLHAQVIYRGREEPSIVTQGVTVSYSIEGNTTSVDKTNFWNYAYYLFGQDLPADIGLTGNGLAGTMTPTGNGDWAATGIPLTPIDDNGQENPYPLATVIVKKNGVEVARTRAVVPVSWEISCNICHNTPGISTATDILRDHDRLHGTNLENEKPVACGSCHGQAPLGTTGTPSLSRAMHHAHAPRMAEAGLAVACYACHPGVRTQCMRGVHNTEGMVCMDCHGDMNAVADATRRPWVDEPKCGDCHQRRGFTFEQTGKLFRESKGHHGVTCEACHGTPHAITPTNVEADNLQAIQWQGHAGVIDTCTVCHAKRPDESFQHYYEGGSEGSGSSEGGYTGSEGTYTGGEGTYTGGEHEHDDKALNTLAAAS